MIADARFDAGRFRAPADDAVGVLLEEGIGGKLATLAAGGAEEIGVPLSSEPKRTLSSDRRNLSALGTRVVQR